MRRFEILLPLRFNDKSPVPEELVGEVLAELCQRFGGVSYETQRIRGFWKHEGKVYRDDLVRVFVDVPDDPEHRAWFVQLKERLKRDFRQLEVWISSHPIDIS